MDTSELARIKICLKKLFSRSNALEWKEVWTFIDVVAEGLEVKDDKIADLEQRLALYRKRYPEFQIMTPPDAIDAWLEANK